jgi:hypothetical protein
MRVYTKKLFLSSNGGEVIQEVTSCNGYNKLNIFGI